MTDQDRLPEIKAQLASVDANKRVRSLGPNLTRVYLDWLIGEVERSRGLLDRLEWIDTGLDCGDYTKGCPICWGEQQHGHEPGCELAKELGR